MNFTENLVLKENYTFLVAGSDGMVRTGEDGLYNRDTRFLSRYGWTFQPELQSLVCRTTRTDLAHQHLSLISGPEQLVGVQRTVQLGATGLSDELLVSNTSLMRRSLDVRLDFAADYADLFEVRGWHQAARVVEVAPVDPCSVALRHTSEDGLAFAAALHFSLAPASLAEDHALFRLRLEPGERVRLGVRINIASPLETALPLPSLPEWQARFPSGSAAVLQAISDLRGLLLATPEGPVAAAGIPWFVTTFGRDSLITAAMLHRWQPALAVGTLRHLAVNQGVAANESRSEQPGKILHELRQGVLARTGVVPFGRYYGSIDSTMLFLMLLGQVNEPGLTAELEPHWRAALRWLDDHADPDGDGFFEFTGASGGKGLTVQSWKDSHDSLSHADGRLASGAIAVSEVQGYAFAAFQAASRLCRHRGDERTARDYALRAEMLQQRFHERFWLEDLDTYALALDGDKTPLSVRSSDAGQLLWTGIVPHEYAEPLVTTLFAEDMWSGWGFRTLSTREVRYNPVSYHNGSVWPHDTALIGLGLRRYGFETEALRVRDALLDLAASQPDGRAPELISGYPRDERPPVPYPVACRPQAWSAAAVLALLS